MTLRIGMIGPGGMGQAHLDRIRTVISGGEIAARDDVTSDETGAVPATYGVSSYASSAELIESPDVDAVMICSYGPAHEADVLACIAAGKRVFCEKPLTPTAAGGERIMAAEHEAGRKVVTFGFLSRFDE